MPGGQFLAVEWYMNERKTEASKLYAKAFGTQPTVVARAPGRVEVLGNHTDYNEGFVLSCAIDRDIHVAVGPAAHEGEFEFVSTHFPGVVKLTEVVARRELGWVNYPLGVCAMLRERSLRCPAFRIAVHGDVPLGAGLSSSAALEISTAIALRELYGLDISDEDLARVGQAAENKFAGAQCGLLDQFSSLFGKQGHLLFTDFRTLDHRTIKLPTEDIRLVLAISGVTHSLAESGYNERRSSCLAAAEFFARRDPKVKTLRDITMGQLLGAREMLDGLLFKRARHVVGENERVQSGIRLLEQGDLSAFGRLLYESHQSSRDFFENSCPQLDTLVSIAATVDEVYGARLSGGGWGGATLTMVPAAQSELYQARIREKYKTPQGKEPEVYEALISAGAQVLHSAR